jgi:hypothetical protein
METLSSAFFPNDLWSFFSNDDTDEFIEIWAKDNRDTNTD